MTLYSQVGRFGAFMFIIGGLLTCFWGYRILKVSLAIFGFIIGSFGGWALGLSLANSNPAISLGCALAGGIVGMVLCVWLYFLGIFLLGASAGVVVAAAFFSGIGQQIQPIVLLVLPIAFGVIAVLAQKFMIILSTAFSGSYLIVAGVWAFAVDNPDVTRIWLHPARNDEHGTLGYGALLLWALLALVGVASQLRTHREKPDAKVQKK